MILRYKYLIKGQVQGVGFRPYVYNIAIDLNLRGYIKNSNSGVTIEIEGTNKALLKFEKNLNTTLPPLATIRTLDKKEIKPLYKGQFEIILSDIQSSQFPKKTASVPPDIAICQKCLLDIKLLPKHYQYFATNCTNCGSRYSIIQTVPYDRDNTSMKDFDLCKSCQDEYDNPLNRRYHAQPIACKNCGPQLTLTVKNQKSKSTNIYDDISKLIKDGKIGAIKGVGGFHIVCDATNDTIVNKLRSYKHRPTKPFAMMCKTVEQINSFALVSTKEQDILKSKEAPIVLLQKLDKDSLDAIAPNIDRVGCMLPYSAFYNILFEYFDTPIVVTSANLGGEPIIITKEDIDKKLSFIDFVVDYNREIVNAIDDSVVQVIDDDIQILRLSRGYAPKELQLPFTIDKKILSIGANQKVTISLAFDDKLILSPYIADLNSLNSLEFFKQTVDTFKRFYDFVPDVIVCDKHPNYETTLWAKKQNINVVQIQHHLAHLYSVKAEYNLTTNYIGFIFDGTGFGDDGTLWGGEIFVNDKRKYYFKPIKLLGGTKAIKECKRVALSLLFNNYSLDELIRLDLPSVKAFTKSEIKLFHNMWAKNLNSPSSSSVGRLFDAVASLANICHIQSYEGEAGLLCEMHYDNSCNDSFKYSITDGMIDIQIDFFDSNIVSKFINTLVKIIIDLSKKENLPIILSGGVFQNKTLLELIIKECRKNNIKYYYNKNIPINDSGVSVGQIWSYIIKYS